MKQLKNDVDFQTILEDYTNYDDIFSEDEPRIRILKRIISTQLSEAEKYIIVMYIEKQSFRKVASKLNISLATCYNYINTIRKKIVLVYNEQTKQRRDC